MEIKIKCKACKTSHAIFRCACGYLMCSRCNKHVICGCQNRDGSSSYVLRNDAFWTKMSDALVREFNGDEKAAEIAFKEIFASKK